MTFRKLELEKGWVSYRVQSFEYKITIYIFSTSTDNIKKNARFSLIMNIAHSDFFHSQLVISNVL